MSARKPECIVAVFGANNPLPGQDSYELARAVGRMLGELGCTVANGGYLGTMEASARGAKEAGARTIGVTCKLWAGEPNAYIDCHLQSEDLYDRVRKLVELAQGGYVVLGGATGTLVELALVWELQAKGFLSRRPIVCVGSFWRPLVEMMAREKPRVVEYISVVQSPAELRRYFKPSAGAGSVVIETPQNNRGR